MALLNNKTMMVVVGKGISIPTKIRDKTEMKRIDKEMLMDLVVIKIPFLDVKFIRYY
jgi:hypothetical protein